VIRARHGANHRGLRLEARCPAHSSSPPPANPPAARRGNGAGNPGGNTARWPQKRRRSGQLPNRGNVPIFAGLAGA
jgi:hypothetical protein